MKQPHEDEPLEQLREEVHQLARRVNALEHGVEQHSVPAAPVAVPDFGLPSAGLIAAAGRAVLGLAGAFLLRALAESGAVPSLLVIAVAIAYAATWLVFSVRTREQNAFAGTAYGITAALILGPLLWEATVRFHALSAPATAVILFVFLGLSSALTWWERSEAVTVVTTLSIVFTVIVLMVQTGDLLPFALALLGIACIVEMSVWMQRPAKMRAPVAFAADFAILLVFFIMSRRGGVPEHYKPVAVGACLALGALLLAIYIASIGWQTVANAPDDQCF